VNPPSDLREFGRFFRCLKDENGARLGLQDFQRAILTDYFGGARELVAILPGKNAKTTLMAALALDHLERVPRAEAVIGAASRDQATILQNQAVMLVEGAHLPHVVRSGYREIRHNGGRLRVLAADSDTADGVIPTLAIVDELHRHRTDGLYQVFRKGLGPRAGRMVTISTAGWDVASPLGVIRAAAHELPTFTRVGAHNHATAGGFAFHEWCLNDGDDLADLRLVKAANPLRAPWKTLSALRADRDSPSMNAATWARFYCGVWTAGSEPWLAADAWDRLRVDIGGLAQGDMVCASMVYSREAAAFGLAARKGDGVGVRVRVLPRAGLPDLEAAILAAAAELQVTSVAYPPALTRSAQILEAAGLPVVEWPLSPQRLAAATATLNGLMDRGALRHDGDPLLRRDVLAGATRDSESGWRLANPRPGLAALLVAVHEATAAEPEAPGFVAL
jgi:phage terminase large subunit-like protein